MTEQQLRAAQKALFNGGRYIADAGLRLEGTKYESDYRKLWSALEGLNNKLVNEIRGGK